MSHPILYSLRNCPYAMRARIAIFKSKKTVILRDVVLNNKPDEMLIASPKGTVPILVLPEKQGKSLVIEESLEVMLWVLAESDPDDLLLQPELQHELRHTDNENHHGKTLYQLPEMLKFIAIFDHEFKTALENYKCAKRYHEKNIIECREACEGYIKDLEQRLNKHAYLFSEQESLVDIALLPFIRQFARIERQWYLKAPYPKLRQWVNQYLQSKMFTKVMAKQQLWLEERSIIYFGGEK